MSDLAALYQEIILDHNRRPRNFREIEDADRRREGRNTLCGDELTLWVKLNGDVIDDVSFLGKGCAISKASASIMTTIVKGRTLDEAEKLFEQFHQMVTAPGPGTGYQIPPGSAPDDASRKMAVFSGVARFPVRVKCASLAWHALHAALTEPPAAAEPVSTEGPPPDVLA
jgi:nitrogen fixation protein NifU and related proteins